MRDKKFSHSRHSRHYHVLSLSLAIMVLGLVATTRIFAEEESPTINVMTSPNVQTASCSYNYSDWSSCQSNGKRSRSITGVSPSGCIQTEAPNLQDSCTYIPPSCTYTYSDWGNCQSNGKQQRVVLSQSPSGCSASTEPSVERNCTYVNSTTTAGTSSLTTACSYSYGSWSSCQSNGKRSRIVTGMSPSGCVQLNVPVLQESCNYSSSTTSSSTENAGPQCLYTYSAWSACQSNGKRTRTLSSKSPTSCEEYVHPVVEQTCIYDTATTGTDSTETKKSVAAPTITVTETNTTSESSGDVTPTFSFLNVDDGMTIRGTLSIRGQVQGAKEVEYYLVPVGSNTYKYIGSGSRSSETVWPLQFRSEEFPNGEFYLRAKIKNMYGEYRSGQRKIRIANDGNAEKSTTEAGFTSFVMNDEKKTELLKKVEEELDLPDEGASSETDKNPDSQKKRIFSYCESNPEKCFPERDSDKDGLSDLDEIRYGTDPQGADSDLDGFIDGDEVKNGFDPVKFSPGDQGDRIVFESPKTAGETKKDIYVVKNIEFKDSDGDTAGTDGKKVRLSGKGLPNSFVTVYIYSDPIVLTVKTDNEGNWVYELDKELEDGEHEAYVAITDNTGKITGKSEPIAFVKTAQAVTVIPDVAPVPVVTLPVTQNRTERDLFFLFAIIIAALAVALATIGLIRHHYAAKEHSYIP